MILSNDLRLALRIVLAGAHLLPLLVLALRWRDRQYSYVPQILYCLLATVWGLGAAVAVGGGSWLPDGVIRVARYIGADFAVVLVGLLVTIAFQNVGRRGRWAWWATGATWTVVALGVHIYLGPEVAQTRQVAALALIGWLVLASLVIAITAWWALRDRLAFHRNRSIYLLMALVPLLGGHVLARGQWWGTGIGLILHLLGTIGVIVLSTTRELPNIKELMRTTVGNTVVVATTALLLLVGLLAGRLLFEFGQDWATVLVASIVLAVVLALVHQPLNRLIAWALNRLFWRTDYDLNQVLHEYGRTISNLLSLEQLATVAVGTLSDVLGVQRGALIMMARGANSVTLRVTEGMGRVDKEEIQLSLNSPILHEMIMPGEPFFQYDLEQRPKLRDVPSEEIQDLRALGMEIFLPIMARERVLGMLVVGAPGTGEPYGQREVSFLKTLAQQTGVALQNAYLFSQMKGLYTKISRLNEDLRSAYTKLMRMDQAKTDFLSIASHELRTPLTVIQGYADILEEMAGTGELGGEQQMEEIVHNLKTPIQRLTAIVTAMLDASTIEVHALDLQFTTTTLQAVLTMALGHWRHAVEERNQELMVEVADGIPPVEVDLQRLSKAIGNIVSNAIKYTPDGGHITVSAKMANETRFEIVITDTGVGIDPDDQELIFEKFYRVGSLMLHSTGDSKFKGAGPGLGLHIARGVVEAHGGQIWVESEGHDEEKCPGSAFHVVLPLTAMPPEVSD
jgi:signal transduction histidine kinase